MIVCYCCSGSWLQHLPVQWYALHKNNPQITKVYLIADSLPQEIERQLSSYNYEWIKPEPNIFNRVNIAGRFTVATLWRLLIPFYIQESKCLYLDSDTLVVKSLEDLWSMPVESIAGVQDTGISVRHLMAMGHRRPYINAGVLLMNLDWLRRNNLHEKWVTMANKRKYHCQDQDIINLTTFPLLLSNEFNSSISTGFHPSPTIIHYAGKKSEDWVKGLPYDTVWNSWKGLYDTEGHSLRMVR